jgi:hypothetical protein
VPPFSLMLLPSMHSFCALMLDPALRMAAGFAVDFTCIALAGGIDIRATVCQRPGRKMPGAEAPLIQYCFSI